MLSIAYNTEFIKSRHKESCRHYNGNTPEIKWRYLLSVQTHSTARQVVLYN